MSAPAFEFQFLYQQNNPQLICRAPEHKPEEYNAGNCYYGVGDVIREYAGIKEEAALPFGIEHFVSFAPEEPHDRDLFDGLPVFLTTTWERARAYELAGTPRGIAIGSAFLYAIRLHHRRHGRPRETRRGTIVFPHKSSTERQRDFDDALFADWLAQLPSEYQPVVVNLYWKDYLRGKDAVYRSRGLEVVSCGHVLDNKFLLRFYDLCRQFRYACSNAMATSFIFAVLSGCQFIYRKTDGHRDLYQDTVTEYKDDPTLRDSLAREALALSPFPPDPGGLKSQVRLARWLAGHRNIRWAWTLRRLHASAHKRLLSIRGTGLDYSQSFSRNQHYAWLPRGIDFDGWIRPEASLLLPPSQSHVRLELFIELPGWACLSELDLDLLVEMKPLGRVTIQPGISVLNAFLTPGERDRRVSLHAHGFFTMPVGDARVCSARLMRFHLHACPPRIRDHSLAAPHLLICLFAIHSQPCS